jgi:hypothetical protein
MKPGTPQTTANLEHFPNRGQTTANLERFQNRGQTTGLVEYFHFPRFAGRDDHGSTSSRPCSIDPS